MTNDTRGAILDALRDRKSHLSPQELMDEYLTGYPTRGGYERIAAGLPEFYAVLATEEYHAHWHVKAHKSNLGPYSSFNPRICMDCGDYLPSSKECGSHSAAGK